MLGICAARAITRYRFTGKRADERRSSWRRWFCPEIIIAISLLLVLCSLGLGLSLFTVVLGHVLICLPYSMTVLISGFEGFDRSLEEASADLGETAFGTLRRVTLPMMTPAIISSLLVSFTISLDEFIIAFFLSGTDPTLPIYIWGQLRFAAKLPGVLALGTLMLVGSLSAADRGRTHAPPRRAANPYRWRPICLTSAPRTPNTMIEISDVTRKLRHVHRARRGVRRRSARANSFRCSDRPAAARPPCCG